MKNAAVRKVAKGIEVSWIPNEMKAVDGYSIYRDGQLIMKLQIRDGQLPRTFVDAEGTVDNVYEVAVYNVIGKESAKVKLNNNCKIDKYEECNFYYLGFVVLCAGCSSSTSVVQDEVSMTKNNWLIK